MSRLLLAAVLVYAPAALGQVALYEDFEDATVSYTTSIPEFSDGDSDFFLRTDGTDISGGYVVTGVSGSGFFAAQDIDGEGASATQSITFSGIDISGLVAPAFTARFAEDDDAANQDWDAPDHVRVYASIDGGAETLIFAIEDQGATNTEPRVDDDLDGVGEGRVITSAFQQFSASLGGTGTTLDLRIEFSLNSGDEDIAIDDVIRGGNCLLSR